MTPLESLDLAMRNGHAVLVETDDGHSYVGTVLHMTSHKVWMVVGDMDKFIPLYRINKVGDHVAMFRGKDQ